ncbi:hypothetical protein NM688_g146 [Phlebia brevispora]|uniref:Uncharacterized protein n=1 Tax=Phlebia brevispora TaxID=194682 RepID=A0ACC1TFB9_9APHY|nr:hypothetical protein NM688_g146 [Phlebia brevispora]
MSGRNITEMSSTIQTFSPRVTFFLRPDLPLVPWPSSPLVVVSAPNMTPFDNLATLSNMFLAVLAFVLAVLAAKYVYALRRRARLPPGPKTSWFGSNQLPKSHQWLTYAQWRRTYGDIVYIYVFGNPIIVLNSADAINDLFEKRSAIYSSRPMRTMVNELMGFNWLFSSMPYGPRWRKHRALFHQHFHVESLPTVHPVILKEVHVLLRNLSDNPDGLFHHARRSAASIVTMLSYGHQIAPEGDDYVTIADTALSGLGKAGIWGTYLVDYFPFLKHIPMWMPGAGFKKQAWEWKQASQAMLNMPFKMVKERMAKGTAIPCFTTTLLEQFATTDRDSLDEELIKDVAAIAYAAGADTTVSAMLSFFLAVTVYPEVQAKAQVELDRVISRSRLPTFEDRADLPYIDCLVWECLRWNPVTPLGLARTVTEDDEYRGYYIPKGTTMMPNVWAILHDEAMYPDPLRFNPDRFADEKRKKELGINEPPLAAFGFGRRLCPGRWLAVETIWITVATVLAVYKVTKARDENGCEIQPDTEYTPTMLSRPKPFRCVFTPRSDIAAELVRQTDEENNY